MEPHLLGNTQLVAGGPDAVPSVLRMLAFAGIDTRKNPDLYVREYAHFGVDEARELRERASLKPVGERRVFVVAAPDINREAQNALLKTLEEPSANALFVFVVPAPEALLPTFRSRANAMHVIVTPEPARVTFSVPSPKVIITPDTNAFLSATPQKRLDMLKPLLEKGEDDAGRPGKRDTGAIITFLSSLERALGAMPEPPPDGLASVYRARKYMTDKGALLKPLLEQVALLVPRV